MQAAGTSARPGALIETLIHAAVRVATLEIVAMGRKQGLSLDTLIQAIEMSTAYGHVSRVVLPALRDGRPCSDAPLASLLRQMNDVVDLGSASKAPLPLAAVARGILQVGVNTQGPGACVDDLAACLGDQAGVCLADAPSAGTLGGDGFEGQAGRAPVMGYVGLGPMGAALARRLLPTHEVHVHDIHPQAVQALVAEGAVAAPDLAALGRACDVVLLCLPTSDVVRRVLFDAGGLAEGLSAGKMVIDQTTGDPAVTRAIAPQLAKQGVVLADAPVSGGPAGAAAGTVAILCGGPAAHEARLRSLLGAISTQVLYCGDTGSGHIVKLVKNALGACNRLITYEAMALAVKCGLRLSDVAGPIRKGPAWNNTFDRILAVLSSGGTTATLRIELMVKDLTLACRLGSDCGAPMLMANAVRNRFEEAVNLLGPDANIDDIRKLAERGAGIAFEGA